MPERQLALDSTNIHEVVWSAAKQGGRRTVFGPPSPPTSDLPLLSPVFHRHFQTTYRPAATEDGIRRVFRRFPTLAILETYIVGTQ